MEYYGFFDSEGEMVAVLKKSSRSNEVFENIKGVFNAEGLHEKKISKEEYEDFD